MVSMSQGGINTIERREFIKVRNLKLAQLRTPFKTYFEIDKFKAQFKNELPRYKFLWIWGETRLGKTELAKDINEAFYHHRNSIDWAEYRPNEHYAVIFDDCNEMENYITNHKMLFQANEITTVNTSKTNCFALTVDTVEKMLIICSNQPPCTTWVRENSFVLHITAPTWVQHG